jgi:hypothetical protein
MNITWIISSLTREISTGIVRYATWIVSVEHNGLSTSITNRTGFYAEHATIPYEELTEAIVLNWVWSNLGADKVKIENELSRNLEDRQPTEITIGLPWSTE